MRRPRRSSAVRFRGWRRSFGSAGFWIWTRSTSTRERALDLGAKTCADLLEARDAADPPPPCPSCSQRTERHSRSAKTFRTRLGPVRVERTCFRCRDCGGGFHQLDRTLGLEGRTVTPGAESLYADAASSDSYEEAGRKLKNLAGVDVPAATLQRHVAGIGEEMQAFEREDAEAEAPASNVPHQPTFPVTAFSF